jgi:hypothetical protein
MSVHEATLYGDLVRYLRDVCGDQIAALKGTSAESERAALDEVIRAWFFAPQEELYGFTPQRVIRNEELGLQNTIPVEYLDEEFFDDCPICQAIRAGIEADVAAGHDHGYGFGLAPESSLLDEYDPEGDEERWRIEDERMAEFHAQCQQEAKQFPLSGADDPVIADEVARIQRNAVDDIPF